MGNEGDKPILQQDEKLRYAVTATRQLVRTLGFFPSYDQILEECGRQLGELLHPNWLLGVAPGASPIGKDFAAVKQELRRQGIFEAAILNGGELYSACPTPPRLVHHIITDGREVSWHSLIPQLTPETPPNFDGYALDELMFLKDAVDRVIGERKNAQILGGGCVQ